MADGDDGVVRVDEVTWAVIAYRRPADLRLMLAELTAVPHLDVLVVNVGGDEGVSAAAADYGARELCVANRGYAAAVNRAAQNSGRPWIIASNDDLADVGSAVVDLTRELAAHPGAVVHPQLRFPDGRVSPTVHATGSAGRFALEWILAPELHQCGRWRDALVRALGRPGRIEKWRIPATCEDVPSATAACFAAPVHILVDVPMPEDYFMYWEDIEWGASLHAAGFDVVVSPSATVTHRGEAAYRNRRQAWFMARGAWLFLSRVHGRRAALLGWPVVVAWQLRLVVTDMLQARPRLALRRTVGLVGALLAPTQLVASRPHRDR